MAELRQEKEDARQGATIPLYAHPLYPYPPPQLDEFARSDVWRVVTRKKLLIFTFALLATLASVAAAVLITPLYRAEVLLAPIDKEDRNLGSAFRSLSAQFGGLADVAGINLGSSGTIEEIIAILGSRAFAERFIRDQNLLPVLFDEKWDAAKGEWIIEEPSSVEKVVLRLRAQLAEWSGDLGARIPRDGNSAPSMWVAYEAFSEILTVSDDPKTGLVTLSMEWKHPVQARDWANGMVELLNEHMRHRAIAQAERRIRYLNMQIGRTSVIEMRQALFRLIENETKTIMLANVDDEYAFRVVDPAVVPEQRSKPKRTLIVIVGFLGGVMLGVFAALFKNSLERQRDEKRDAVTA